MGSLMNMYGWSVKIELMCFVWNVNGFAMQPNAFKLNAIEQFIPYRHLKYVMKLGFFSKDSYNWFLKNSCEKENAAAEPSLRCSCQ